MKMKQKKTASEESAKLELFQSY